MPLFRRFGRPGLLGLAAGTAVVAGTATAVSGGMRRSQQRREQEDYEAQQYENSQAAAVAAPPPAAASGEAALVGQIRNLGDLHASGVLSDDEFAAAKAKLLAS
ncbi:MAG TPA: SHOCT domain-containing protein [Galbitalea sp.]